MLCHVHHLYSFFQPLRLDIKRKLSARSDRVKTVDLHPSEPWMLASLYNGNVHIWNFESQVPRGCCVQFGNKSFFLNWEAGVKIMLNGNLVREKNLDYNFWVKTTIPFFVHMEKIWENIKIAQKFNYSSLSTLLPWSLFEFCKAEHKDVPD